MKTMYNMFGLYLMVFFVITGCENKIEQRERASDGIISITDSIYTEVPSLSRLCDSLEIRSFKVSIGECNLYVEEEGEGDPIVLINGGPGGTHHYFHPWFSQLKLSNKIIYYDQRGTGQSDFVPGAGYSIEQAVEDLNTLRKELGIEQWVLCGYSYGGGLAQLYSLKYPEHVKGMVLISTLVMLPDEQFISNQEAYFSSQEKERKNTIIKAYVNGELSMSAFLYNLSLNGDWKRQHYLKPTKNEMIRHALYEWVNDGNFNNDVSMSCAKYNFKDAFNSSPIPTLIFEGEKDLTWGQDKARIVKKNHPKAQFHKILNAGHPIFSEASEYFFTVLDVFLRNLGEVDGQRIIKWKQQLEKLELMN